MSNATATTDDTHMVDLLEGADEEVVYTRKAPKKPRIDAKMKRGGIAASLLLLAAAAVSPNRAGVKRGVRRVRNARKQGTDKKFVATKGTEQGAQKKRKKQKSRTKSKSKNTGAKG